MLPGLVDSAPAGDDWIHELKYDGYRTQLIIDRGEARAFTRRGHDWSHLYGAIIEAARGLDCRTARIDGEVIVQDWRGLSDFAELRSQLARRKPDGLVFMAFDLLHLDGRDLRREPVEDRRSGLRDILGANQAARAVQFSDHVVGGGPEFFALAERTGLEGIVSKKLGSLYRSGPAKAWLKTKSFTDGEFVVIGTSRGDRAPVALLARETDDRRLEYAGAAMVTFSESDRERFWRANERLKTDKPALHMDPRPETSWLRPEMRVIVRHLRGEEMLRHATVKAIAYIPPERAPATSRPRGAASSREPAHLVEHGSVPDREALLAYYRAVAPLILPHIIDRPLNLFRCHGRYCVFQRNRNHPATDQDFGEPIRTIPILQKNGRTEDYLTIDDLDGLLACVEAGAVEFHAWGSRVPDYERPDRIAIDLDPGDGIGFDEVKRAAFEVRDRLTTLGLASFALLTGGKGIHVVVPFAPDGDWEAVRAFAQGFCARLAGEDPDRFTVAISKAHRTGRIFLDYLRNQRTATAVMPYSVRARPGSPVASPVGWHRLADIDSPAAFTIAEAAELVRRAKRRSLKGWGSAEQNLPAEPL